jgi:hypothetical protein
MRISEDQMEILGFTPEIHSINFENPIILVDNTGFDDLTAGIIDDLSAFRQFSIWHTGLLQDILGIQPVHFTRIHKDIFLQDVF